MQHYLIEPVQNFTGRTKDSLVQMANRNDFTKTIYKKCIEKIDIKDLSVLTVFAVTAAAIAAFAVIFFGKELWALMFICSAITAAIGPVIVKHNLQEKAHLEFKDICANAKDGFEIEELKNELDEVRNYRLIADKTMQLHQTFLNTYETCLKDDTVDPIKRFLDPNRIGN